MNMATGVGAGTGQPLDCMNISEGTFFRDAALCAPLGKKGGGRITPKVYFSEFERVAADNDRCKFPLPRSLWDPSKTIMSTRQYTIMEDLSGGGWSTMGGALECLEQVHSLGYSAAWVDKTLDAVAQLHVAHMGIGRAPYPVELLDTRTTPSTSTPSSDAPAQYAPAEWDCYGRYL